jgi:hypothetical protein
VHRAAGADEERSEHDERGHSEQELLAVLPPDEPGHAPATSKSSSGSTARSAR